MLVLQTNTPINQANKETLRKEIMERTGEDCIILDSGFNIERFKVKKEQPLWRRLFWRR